MNGLDATRWSRVDAAFSEALGLPENMRLQWLKDELSDAPDLLARASALLKLEQASRSPFERLQALRDRALGDLSDDDDAGSADPRIDGRYGPWRILRRIGSGGLSVVYEAKRDDGRYDHLVALKVLRNDLRNGDAIRHFIRERKILSTLDHPGIVRILDGGETATGAPWLAMDLAPGRSITEFVQAAGLDLRARLLLVADVADAVQAAHSKLIVHRDIKPENIVVSDDGRARLLDFGVSGFLETGEGADGVAMTPEYASPEQRRLEEVGVASDIYQLGRVLSDITHDLAGTPSADLGAVVGKATAEAPHERYATAEGFANDLRRLADGRATRARPDAPVEAAIRLVRRNKVSSALAAMLLAGIAGWGVMLSVHARAMEAQRAAAVMAADRADRGRSVLLSLFRRFDPLESDGVASTGEGLSALVDPTLTDVRERLPDDPALQAELIGWGARAKERSGDVAGAFDLANEAVSILGASDDRASSAYAAALAYRGTLALKLGREDEGAKDVEQALVLANLAAEADAEALDVFLMAAWSYDGDWAKQRDAFRQALPRAVAAGSLNGEIEARDGLARALNELGDSEDAEAEARKAVALAEEGYGADHPRLALSLSDLGRILVDRGKTTEAIAVHERALKISEAAFGADNASTLSHRNNLAVALSEAGRQSEAIDALEDVLAIRIRLEGSDSRGVGDVLQNLAATQAEAGQLEAALVSLARAEAIYAQRLPENYPARVFPALTRSGVLLDLRRYKAAELDARRAFAVLSEQLPDGHFATAVARCRIGLARLGQGDRAGARAELTPALTALALHPETPERYVRRCRDGANALGPPSSP
ncbi:MAG: serine/threonine-protein kinase [Hyphomonadaceae bacterium]